MPYITQPARERLDKEIAALASRIQSSGELNYAITRLLLATTPQTYSDYNALVGVLECAKLELYRRAVAKYEDGKALTNGDVYGG